jgi:hypothetical protein
VDQGFDLPQLGFALAAHHFQLSVQLFQSRQRSGIQPAPLDERRHEPESVVVLESQLVDHREGIGELPVQPGRLRVGRQGEDSDAPDERDQEPRTHLSLRFSAG